MFLQSGYSLFLPTFYTISNDDDDDDDGVFISGKARNSETLLSYQPQTCLGLRRIG